MSIAKDVVINIQRLTAGISSPSFGLTLIVCTEQIKAYQEYSSASAVGIAYGSSSSAYKAAVALFSQEPKPKKVAVVGITQNTAFSEIINSLNLVVAAHNDWYYLVCDNNTPDAIAALSSFAAVNKKMYFSVVTKADLGTVINPLQDRAVIQVIADSNQRDEYVDAAGIGAVCAYAPGSATWKFKALKGISPVPFDDQMTEVETISEMNFNTYVTKHGLNQTSEGLCTSGEYIDIMLGVDWLEADMETRIASLLVSNPKVPYDNSGIALIAAEVETSLRLATKMGLLRKNNSGNGKFAVNTPDISEISVNDIANREFKDLTWSATLAGAIHTVEINGTV
jgi:hypothetical protein